MKTIKNISDPKILRIDLERGRFLDCYYCGEPMDESTRYMHHRCWENASDEIRWKAEGEMRVALQNNRTSVIFKGEKT